MKIDNYYKTIFETEQFKHIKGYQEKAKTHNGFCIPWVKIPGLLRLQSQMFKHAFDSKFESYHLIEFNKGEWSLNHFQKGEIISITKIEKRKIGIYELYNVGFGLEWKEKK